MCPPFYEFECPECHQYALELKSMNDTSETNCTVCLTVPMQKIMSASYGQLKGTKTPVLNQKIK